MLFALDFETYYDDECNIKKLGLEGYLNHDKFDAYLVSIVGTNGFEWVGEPKEFNWHHIEESNIVSHNASFDESVYLHGAALGWWPKVSVATWSCTADLCTSLGYPRSLKGAMYRVYGIKASKKIRNDMKGKQWIDLNEKTKADVVQYCLEDSRMCLSLWIDLNDDV